MAAEVSKNNFFSTAPKIEISLGEIKGVNMNNVLHEKVEKALESIRPYLIADGGNVELVKVTPEGIVEVKLTGACTDCPCHK